MTSTPNDRRSTTQLDELDLRLVELLRADGRMSNSQLAAALGVAPSTAHVRLRSLQERGVIDGFAASVDQARLGRTLQALVGVTLRHGSRQASITGFAETIRDLPEVLQVFFLGGVDDYIIHVAVPDSSALRRFVVENISANPGVASTRTSVVFDYHRNGVAASFR
ncbi:Lrp/AsnC family transcriptional regulator [Homoserinibacter sp. YIM 151385]|uniref:Lrp/AsnC family transcriptional regulator n=1 Tax=Homoserinibacter sp. YIM 151385 TaxID=2985506 RepID=UPI0022F0DCE9|nr:Lrp/AsnC family transcriptional regulator [Homoserinibacter sp. YIM 151385]WBU38230.1 Lrp/AsnC family transcriptional regulator [Homoserinibacter sp. YIM 151385]